MQQPPELAGSPRTVEAHGTVSSEQPDAPAGDAEAVVDTAKKPMEIGGRDGPEPTRFGDWEKAGRCIDF